MNKVAIMMDKKIVLTLLVVFACSAGYWAQGASINQTPSQSDPEASISLQNFGIQHNVTVGDKIIEDQSAPELSMVQDGINCIFCKAFVSMLKFMGKNQTEKSVEGGLRKMCSLIHWHNIALRRHCDEMVDLEGSVIAELLIDPGRMCHLLAQCTFNPTPIYKTLDSPISPAHLAPAASLLSLKPTNELPVKPLNKEKLITILDSVAEPSSMKICSDCKIFVDLIRTTLKNPESEIEIRNWILDDACSALGDKLMVDACRRLALTYATTFINAIVHQLNSMDACLELKACNNEGPRVGVKVIDNKLGPIDSGKMVAGTMDQMTTLEKPEVINTETCERCIAYVEKIKDHVTVMPINQDVSILINQVCNQLTDQAKTECTFLVNVFGRDIEQAISTMESPKQLCTKIDLC